MELPDPSTVPADLKLLVDEARIGCTTGMLLCLDREQRLVYVLGEIFGVTDAIGAELLEISRQNFRQKLARVRRDLHSFMQNQCGLVNTANPCRCAKKTQGFAKAGYLNPEKLLFARDRVTRVRDVAEKNATSSTRSTSPMAKSIATIRSWTRRISSRRCDRSSIGPSSNGYWSWNDANT